MPPCGPSCCPLRPLRLQLLPPTPPAVLPCCIKANAPYAPYAPVLPLSQRKIHTRVIYNILLWAVKNAATPQGGVGALCNVPAMLHVLRKLDAHCSVCLTATTNTNRTYPFHYIHPKTIPFAFIIYKIIYIDNIYIYIYIYII